MSIYEGILHVEFRKIAGINGGCRGDKTCSKDACGIWYLLDESLGQKGSGLAGGLGPQWQLQ